MEEDIGRPLLKENICFWVLRRIDTGEYYRPSKSSRVVKSNWINDVTRAKVYGRLGFARSAKLEAIKVPYNTIPKGALSIGIGVDILRMRVVEEAIEV